MPLVYLRFLETELSSEHAHLLLRPDRVLVELHIEQLRLVLVLLKRRLHFLLGLCVAVLLRSLIRSSARFGSIESLTLSSDEGLFGIYRRLIE